MKLALWVGQRMKIHLIKRLADSLSCGREQKVEHLVIVILSGHRFSGMSYSRWPQVTVNEPDESSTYKHAVCSQDVNIQEPNLYRISNSNVISFPEAPRIGIVLGEGKR